MGTTEGAKARFRGGREWPDKCHGSGKYQHQKGCHPARPLCKARRKVNSRYRTCNCEMPHYPHRIGSVDWVRGGACVHHPEHDRIVHEMMTLTDWEDGSPIDPSDICSDRYR